MGGDSERKARAPEGMCSLRGPSSLSPRAAQRMEGGPLVFTAQRTGSSPLPAQTATVMRFASSPTTIGTPNPLAPWACHRQGPVDPNLSSPYPRADKHTSSGCDLSSGLGAPCDLRWPLSPHLSPSQASGRHPPSTASHSTVLADVLPCVSLQGEVEREQGHVAPVHMHPLLARCWDGHDPQVTEFDPQITW